MKIIIKLLRGLGALLSISAWMWYMLVTSDIPPNVLLSDLYTFITLYSIIFFITITDFIMCVKCKYRGGYFTLLFELIILGLWLLSCKGIDLQAGNGWTVYAKFILFGGFITTLLQIVFQSIITINYLIKH